MLAGEGGVAVMDKGVEGVAVVDKGVEGVALVDEGVEGVVVVHKLADKLVDKLVEGVAVADGGVEGAAMVDKVVERVAVVGKGWKGSGGGGGACLGVLSWFSGCGACSAESLAPSLWMRDSEGSERRHLGGVGSPAEADMCLHGSPCVVSCRIRDDRLVGTLCGDSQSCVVVC